eukprot:TRINITY_DN56996_c0_g1_i1.p1 TRINITY_DN56996_c0_g1~~TRINITY_DN56996_c0_g1_i1.p1  ORF type:complete len:561 (+),score=94.64 TRINITY_DN56996_c0_g1_i1:64-1683(+)
MAQQLPILECSRAACGSCSSLAFVSHHSAATCSPSVLLIGHPCSGRNARSGRRSVCNERNTRSGQLRLCSAAYIFACVAGFHSRRLRKHLRRCTQQRSLELDQNLRGSAKAEDDLGLLRFGDWCALVVNLARRPDRMKKFKDVYAARAPLIFDRLERIEAVDGRKLSFEDERMSSWLERGTLAKAKRARELNLYTVVHDKNNLLVHFDDHFTEGAVACALSHLEALRRIATHPTASWGLIFEDDVSLIIPEVEKSISLIVQKLPADWDAVYLGYHHDDGKPHPAAVGQQLARPDACAVDVPILPVSGQVWGLFALMIRKEAAEDLVQHLFPLRTQVDGAISSWLVRNGRNVFQVPPEQLLFYSSCSEEAQDTDIQTMKSDAAVAQEYGSVQEYLKVQKQAGVDPYTQNMMRLLMAQYTRTWTAKSYSLVGSFNDWTINPESLDGIIHVGSQGASESETLCREEFQIVGDGSWEKRVFPAGGSGDKGVILVKPGEPSPAAEGDGEAGRGHGRNWAVDGPPGSSFRVSYDPEAMTVMCEKL